MKRSLVRNIILFGTLLCAQLAVAQAPIVPTSQSQITLSFAPIVKKASPAVVNIYTKRTEQVRFVSPFMNDPIFGQFFGDQFGGMGGMPRERVVRSLGSGVIVSADGTAVTSYHVIKGADQITVILANKSEFEATVIKTDERSDLAVLKIKDAKNLPYLNLRDSDTLEVGDLVLAIGNPFGVGQTVTQGIVSALARAAEGVSDYQFFIQTDAAINPGNSGGALVDSEGKLVGINTAIYSTSGGSNGIGFAIPANMVKAVLDGKAEQSGKMVRPWLGFSGSAVTPEMADSLGFTSPQGVIVEDVYEDSPAQKAGLSVGDVILKFAGKDVSSMQDLNFRVATAGIGQEVELEVIRVSKPLILKIIPIGQDAEREKIKTVALQGKHPLRGLVVADITALIADTMNLPSTQKGVVIVQNTGSRGAFGMQLRTGDIILQVNDVKITSAKQLQSVLAQNARGWEIVFKRGDIITTIVIR